jgi:hypothetical protein
MRMGLPVDFFQLFQPHVGVYLGSGDAGMSQHLLNDTDIRTVIQKMGGKTVPEGMG